MAMDVGSEVELDFRAASSMAAGWMMNWCGDGCEFLALQMIARSKIGSDTGSMLSYVGMALWMDARRSPNWLFGRP